KTADYKRSLLLQICNILCIDACQPPGNAATDSETLSVALSSAFQLSNAIRLCAKSAFTRRLLVKILMP
ncbi:MAG: hypothetical protein L0J54_08125, partial [Halomonas sp.]